MYRFQAYERNNPWLQESIHAQGMKRPQGALTLNADVPILLRPVSTGVIQPWTPSSIRWLFNLRTEGKKGGAPWGYEITEAFEGELLYAWKAQPRSASVAQSYFEFLKLCEHAPYLVRCFIPDCFVAYFVGLRELFPFIFEHPGQQQKGFRQLLNGAEADFQPAPTEHDGIGQGREADRIEVAPDQRAHFAARNRGFLVAQGLKQRGRIVRIAHPVEEAGQVGVFNQPRGADLD